eukprot:CAMPEP_0198507922 /NCGR_PEP_ID=MMETSP1462-20131121/12626_1 /TAXON_ID=1333877 /ORGANISM="Brandtodinium nutriculum, Strain RCC3387" /LENGTH=62 /DNA_ID=CAMNT_0044237183 /DNA_START=1 /DNA_END=186 /DNA_ORIENTATION=-
MASPSSAPDTGGVFVTRVDAAGANGGGASDIGAAVGADSGGAQVEGSSSLLGSAGESVVAVD